MCYCCCSVGLLPIPHRYCSPNLHPSFHQQRITNSFLFNPFPPPLPFSLFSLSSPSLLSSFFPFLLHQNTTDPLPTALRTLPSLLATWPKLGLTMRLLNKTARERYFFFFFFLRYLEIFPSFSPSFYLFFFFALLTLAFFFFFFIGISLS